MLIVDEDESLPCDSEGAHATGQVFVGLRSSDFGYLARRDACCDDAEDSFWRYLAVKRKTLFTALACALLVFSMLGCGTTNHLQSITLSVSNTDANAGNGFILYTNLPVPMYIWGNYSSGKQQLLYGNQVAFQIVSTPVGFPETGDFGDPNATPPGTVQLSTDGQLTPVLPAACSFVNVAQPPLTTPSFESTGWYTVTATYQGFTTPPGSVYLATEGGIVSTSNPTGECYYPPSGS